MSFEDRSAIQLVEMRAPSPPENRVRFADSVTAFEDCLLWEATDKKISHNQESLRRPNSQRWEEALSARHLVMRVASRSTAAVQQFFTVLRKSAKLAARGTFFCVD
jgi:tRNA(Met) C34 N-acetyltransferase TmcA